MDTLNQTERLSEAERAALSTKNRQRKGFKTFSMMLSPDMHQMLDAIAEEKGLQKKQLFEQYIRQEYKNLHAA